LGLVDGLELEVGRQHGQVGKTPLATLDVELLGRSDFDQVAHRRGDDVVLVLEVVVVLVELARHRRERTHDVLRHGGLLGNDQCFVHLYNSASLVYTRAGGCTRIRAPHHDLTLPNLQALTKTPSPPSRHGTAPTRRIQPRRSGVHGKGVFALADLAEGETLIEYTGEIITWAE